MKLRLAIAAVAVIGAGCQALDDRVAELPPPAPIEFRLQQPTPARDPCRGPPDINHLFEAYNGLKTSIPEAHRVHNPSIKRFYDRAEEHYARAQELYQRCVDAHDYTQANREAIKAFNAMVDAVALNDDFGGVTISHDPELVKMLR